MWCVVCVVCSVFDVWVVCLMRVVCVCSVFDVCVVLCVGASEGRFGRGCMERCVCCVLMRV